MRLEANKEVVDWLWAIDNSYGQVETVAASGVSLRMDDPPLDATQRKAIEKAAQALSGSGRFVGMLPVGAYVVGGEALVVTSGRRAALAL